MLLLTNIILSITERRPIRSVAFDCTSRFSLLRDRDNRCFLPVVRKVRNSEVGIENVRNQVGATVGSFIGTAGLPAFQWSNFSFNRTERKSGVIDRIGCSVR